VLDEPRTRPRTEARPVGPVSLALADRALTPFTSRSENRSAA
jgi:hypothetical protein